MPCAGALPLTALNEGAPQEFPWTWFHQEARHLLVLERDAATWVYLNTVQERKEPQGQTLVQRGKLLGKGQKDGTSAHVPARCGRKLPVCC